MYYVPLFRRYYTYVRVPPPTSPRERDYSNKGVLLPGGTPEQRNTRPLSCASSARPASRLSCQRQAAASQRRHEPRASGPGLAVCRLLRLDLGVRRYHARKANVGFMLEAKGSVEPEAWNRLSVLYHLAWPSVMATFRPSLCQG